MSGRVIYVPHKLKLEIKVLAAKYLADHYLNNATCGYGIKYLHSYDTPNGSCVAFQIVVDVKGLGMQYSSECFVSSSGKINYCGKPANFSVPKPPD